MNDEAAARRQSAVGIKVSVSRETMRGIKRAWSRLDECARRGASGNKHTSLAPRSSLPFPNTAPFNVFNAFFQLALTRPRRSTREIMRLAPQSERAGERARARHLFWKTHSRPKFADFRAIHSSSKTLACDMEKGYTFPLWHLSGRNRGKYFIEDILMLFMRLHL